MNHQVIGVFDSGVGGKLIADQLGKTLPSQKVIFISDNKHFPYGSKPVSFIKKRAEALTQRLINQGCTLIVIACNTITTNMIVSLRKKYSQIVFVGIEPPVKPVAKLSKTKHAAILGTAATIKSPRLKQLISQFSGNVEFYPVASRNLASFIETKIINHQTLTLPQSLIKKIDSLASKGVDTIGLACTHYPYLINHLKKHYPQINFYNPADTVIKRVRQLVSVD